MTEKTNDSGKKAPQIPPLNIPENLTLRQALSVLADYALSDTLHEEFSLAMKENYGTDEIFERLGSNDRMAFMEYFIFDRLCTRWDKSPARIFAESAYGLSDALRAKFFSLSNAALDYYTATEIRENILHIKSLGHGRTVAVADKQLSSAVKSGDIMLARVVKWEDEFAFSGVVNLHRNRPEQMAQSIRTMYEKLGEENWKAVMRMLPRMIWSKLRSFSETDEGRKVRKGTAYLSQSELFEQANSHLRATNFEVARLYIEEYNTRYPGSTEGMFLAGSANLHTGRYEEAYNMFAMLVKNIPENASARINLAVSMTMLGKLEEALGEYQQCLLSSPAKELLPAILNGIGYLASILGDHVQGKKAFEQAAKLAENDHAALSVIVTNLLQVDDFKLAAKLVRRMIKLNPDEMEQYVTLGDIQMRTDDSGGAVKSYRRAIERDDSNVLLFRRLGDAQLCKGDDKEAVKSYLKYAAVFPGDPEVHNNIGLALLGLKMVKEAAAAFEQALKFNPDHVSSLNNLAKLLISTGELDRAEKCLERSKELAPDKLIVQELGFILAEERRKHKARGA